MWACKKRGEAIEDSFDACWSCGTSRNGTADSDFHAEEVIFSEPSEPEATHVVEEADATLDHGLAPLSASREKRICLYCGSKRLKRHVTMSQATEAGSVGLQYRSILIFSGTEHLLADLCLKCGAVQRLHVRTTDRKWITE